VVVSITTATSHLLSANHQQINRAVPALIICSHSNPMLVLDDSGKPIIIGTADYHRLNQTTKVFQYRLMA